MGPEVMGEVGASVGEGIGSGSRLVGEGLMKREMSSGVVVGVTFSTRVHEGSNRTVVGWDSSEAVW